MVFHFEFDFPLKWFWTVSCVFQQLSGGARSCRCILLFFMFYLFLANSCCFWTGSLQDFYIFINAVLSQYCRTICFEIWLWSYLYHFLAKIFFLLASWRNFGFPLRMICDIFISVDGALYIYHCLWSHLKFLDASPALSDGPFWCSITMDSFLFLSM